MTDAAILGQFEIDKSGALREVNKVCHVQRNYWFQDPQYIYDNTFGVNFQIKLSGKGHSLSWAGNGVLAIISEDLSVRLWDVESGENFVLEPKVSSSSYSSDECFISVDYNVKTG